LSLFSDEFNLNTKSAINMKVTIESKMYIAHICLSFSGNRYSEKTMIIEATVITATVVFIIAFLCMVEIFIRSLR
jgi:hypothetical protein